MDSYITREEIFGMSWSGCDDSGVSRTAKMCVRAAPIVLADLECLESNGLNGQARVETLTKWQ